MGILTGADLGDCPFRNIGYHVVDNSSNDIRDPRQQNREASGASTENTDTRSLHGTATVLEGARITRLSGRNIGHTVTDKSLNNRRIPVASTERGAPGVIPQDQCLKPIRTVLEGATVTDFSGRNVDYTVTDDSSNDYCGPEVPAQQYILAAGESSDDLNIRSSDGAPTVLKGATFASFKGRNVGYTVTDNSSNNCSVPTSLGSRRGRHTGQSPAWTGIPTVLEGASITQDSSGRNVGLIVTDNSSNNCGTRSSATPPHGGGSGGSPINQRTRPAPAPPSTPSVLKGSTIKGLSGRNIGITVTDYSENNEGGSTDSAQRRR